ncbi:MAG: Elongation factor 4 [Myxococcota bacterium]|nr:Elongation factor 4 [Myxococcota bacterium]
MDQAHIRNFCIIAHIDHGKSTLADRILEITEAISEREKRDQMLDKMDLERERGITIKASAVRLQARSSAGERYIFNLIDTPGHVDFAYEVSRSLAACEGALLVVDASQGVEAQTLANVYLAMSNNLELVPIINKIDLPSADVDAVRKQIEEDIGLDASSALPVSAKTGLGCDRIVDAVINTIPAPSGDPDGSLRALIIDSWFDNYLGVVALVRIVDGKLVPGMQVKMMSQNLPHEVTTTGYFNPHPVQCQGLFAGEVGFFAAGVKNVSETRIGDTVTSVENPASEPLPGFKEAKPMVFCGIFPADSAEYIPLREALEKLKLNDSAFSFEKETSQALGFGFRCGFLGLLHMDIVQERLEREFNLTLVSTAPTVVYEVETLDGRVVRIDNPSSLPSLGAIKELREPYIAAQIHVPEQYVGMVIKLCEERRGQQKNIQYTSGARVIIEYELPMAEIAYDFFDKLKSVSKGYASMDYELKEYRPSNLVLLDILLNGDKVDALSVIVHRETAYHRGRVIVSKLRELIPKQQYEVAVQAAIGNKVISRETIKALRKNVTAKCYGGDITRKRKLLEKQKEGKKRMKQVGSVEVPQEAFLAVLATEE